MWVVSILCLVVDRIPIKNMEFDEPLMVPLSLLGGSVEVDGRPHDRKLGNWHVKAANNSTLKAPRLGRRDASVDNPT